MHYFNDDDGSNNVGRVAKSIVVGKFKSSFEKIEYLFIRHHL